MEVRGLIDTIKLLVGLVALVATLIASWILGMRMRRQIKRATGANIQSEAELTSLNTWMRVKDIEENNRGGKLQ
jgi:hypothetical protein